MAFSTLVIMCNWLSAPSISRTFSASQTDALYTWNNSPLPLPQDLVPSVLLSVSMNLPILASTCKWNHTNLGFCGLNKKKVGIFQADRQEEKKGRQAKCHFPWLFHSLARVLASLPHRMVPPSLHVCVATVPMRLLLAAPSAVHLSSFRFLPVLQEADFPLASSIRWAQKQGCLSLLAQIPSCAAWQGWGGRLPGF